VLRLYPRDIGNTNRRRLAFKDRAIKEVDSDGLRRIVVIDGKKFVIYSDFYSEFLDNLAMKGRIQ